MKKFVVVGLVVLLMLGLTGVALAGPHGLWTDTVTVSAHGTTGSVDIATRIRCIRFDDYIQPGEQLVVRWWLKNVGDCPVDVYVVLNGVPWYLEARFFPGTHFKLAPGTAKQVALGIRMALGTSDHAQDRHFTIQVVMTAVQDSNRHQTP